ncbi:MAG: hypothetical protein ACRDPW_01560, partial [Mycobacteriales bacterium]
PEQLHQPHIFVITGAYIFLALLLVAFLPVPKDTPLVPQLLPGRLGKQATRARKSAPRPVDSSGVAGSSLQRSDQ